MSRRDLLGVGAAACVACCIAPVLGLLGAVAALSLASTLLIGAAGVLIAGATFATIVLILRRRHSRTCIPDPAPVPVKLTTRPG